MGSLLTRIGIATACGVVGLGLGAGAASAAKVKNGNFETGTLAGWQQDFSPESGWFPYEGTFPPMMSPPRGFDGPPVPEPPQGQWGAITNQEERSAQILSQVVKLRANRKHKLRFELAYTNRNDGGGGPPPRGGGFGPGFFTPNHLRFGTAATPNQQFRMDVVKPGAPINSLKPKHVLDRVYRTNRGDANHRAYRTITANLTPYAGKKVRLRFAVVVTEEVLNVGIDAVKVKTKRR